MRVLGRDCACVFALFLFIFFNLRTIVVQEVCRYYPLFFFRVFFPKYESLIKINPWLKSAIIFELEVNENFTLSSLFQRSGLIIRPNATGGSWLLSGLAFKDIQSSKQKLKQSLFSFYTEFQGNTKRCMKYQYMQYSCTE